MAFHCAYCKPYALVEHAICSLQNRRVFYAPRLLPRCDMCYFRHTAIDRMLLAHDSLPALLATEVD